MPYYLSTMPPDAHDSNRLSHVRRLKNNNTIQQPAAVWRYQHFDSGASFNQKRAVMSAALKKVHHMSGDGEAMQHSAIQKLAEFARLGYPRGLLRQQCSRMAAITSDYEWIQVRDQVMRWFPNPNAPLTKIPKG